MTDETPTSSDRAGTGQADEDGAVQHIDLTAQPYGIYQCRDCRNVVLTLRDCGDKMTCHGDPMEPVREAPMDVKPPDIREVLLSAFGLPKRGLDICLCVIGEGPLSPAEVADRLEYDENTIRTYLNKLVDLGLLTRSQLNREGGGFVNVYHSVDLDRMRRETLMGFYVWAGEAASLIEEANITKREYLEENPDRELPDVFWASFSGSD